jgi:flagellar hook assembly protein FlgD
LRVHPNPFSASTTIAYTAAQDGNVRIQVYDVRGRLVRTLADRIRVTGNHVAEWDGFTRDGSPAPSGVYFVRVEAGGRALTQRLVKLQ